MDSGSLPAVGGWRSGGGLGWFAVAAVAAGETGVNDAVLGAVRRARPAFGPFVVVYKAGTGDSLAGDHRCILVSVCQDPVLTGVLAGGAW
jgi:hypothetical protein